MPNILEEYNATSKHRIDDKTEIYSVTTEDVGLTVREGVELALLYPQADIVKTYPKDFITRDVAYNLFISLQNNVSGDTANGANWQPLSSNASQSVYDLGVISDDFANGYEATVPPIASYSTSNIYLFKPDNTNTGASTLQINALAVLPIKKYISGAIANVAAGDLNLANTYLLIYKTTYFLIASVSSGGGGVSTFSALTDSPYDNTLLAEALDSKQDKPNGVLTGCTITLGSFPLGKNVRITEGTWRISPGEYGNVGSGDTDFLVALSASGLQRYVEIVGTSSNTIIKVEGAENAIAVRPTLGAGQTSLGSILVKDALIDPPVPDLSGYIPLTGTALMNGDIRRTQTSGDFNQVSFGSASLSIENNNLITYGYKVELNLNIAQASLIVSTPTTQRGIYVQANNKIAILDDIAIYSNLSHAQISTKLNAEPYGLITKQYFDDNAPSGVTNLGYTPSPTNGIVTSDTGTDATIPLADGTNAGLSLNDYTSAEKTKLSGIATGALAVQVLQQLQVLGSLKQTAVTINSNLTISTQHRIIYVDVSANDVTITLPNPASFYANVEYEIKCIAQTSSFQVFIVPHAGGVSINVTGNYVYTLGSAGSNILIRNRTTTMWETW